MFDRIHQGVIQAQNISPFNVIFGDGSRCPDIRKLTEPQRNEHNIYSVENIRPSAHPITEEVIEELEHSLKPDGRPYVVYTVSQRDSAAINAAMASIRTNWHLYIDEQAEVARMRFITGGAGQALQYQRKLEQARDYMTRHHPDPAPAGLYPALEVEVGITGEDVQEVAQVIVNNSNTWGAIGDHIEDLRLSAKRAIDALVDPDTITDDAASIALNINWPQPEI